MKRYLFLAFIFSIMSAFSIVNQQRNTYGMPVDETTGKITYVEKVEEPGTKDVLYERAYAWAKKYFVNISSTIKTRDQEGGILAGVTRFKVQTTDKKGNKVEAGVIMFDFSIEFKDNKYRIIETNFRQADNSGNPVEEWFDDTNEKAIPLHQEIFQQIDNEAKQMIISLKAGMKPQADVTDEW